MTEETEAGMGTVVAFTDDGAVMATGLGIGSLPSAMLPSATRDPLGSRAKRSRASTQREASGQTSLHSMRMARVRWSIMGPSRVIEGSGQTIITS